MPPPTRLCTALGFAALHSMAAATEAPPPSEELLVTALRIGDPFGEHSGLPLSLIPQSLQVLTEADFEMRGVRTIGDAMRAVPSASVGSPRGVPFQNVVVTIRGFAADQMRNGVRQRYFESIDPSALSNIDRIEVLKGPSAVLFGQSAVGGIISIITKRPKDHWASSVGMTLGSFNQFEASMDITGPLAADGALGFRLTGEIERSGTSVDFVPLNRQTIALTLGFEPAPGVAGVFIAEYQSRSTVGNPGLPPIGTVLPNGIAPIPTSRNLTEPSFAYLDLDAPLVQAWLDVDLGRDWTLTPRLSWNGYNVRLARTGLLDVVADLRTVRRFGFAQTDSGSFLIGQIDLAHRLTTGRISHELLLGLELSSESLHTSQDRPASVAAIDVLTPIYGRVSAPPWPAFFRASSELGSMAFYGQDLIGLGDAVNLVLGLRHGKYEAKNRFNAAQDRTRFTGTAWQAGLTWQLGGGVSAYGGYNTGYNFEATAGARSATGVPLAPETSGQAEIGLRLARSRVNGSASLFQIVRNNVLSADPLNPGFSLQTGRQRVSGLEVEGNWDAGNGVSVQAGYVHFASRVVTSTNGDEGNPVADVPANQANIFVAWSPARLPGLSLRAGANYVGPRLFSNARVPIGPGLLASDVELPGYTVAQFGVGFTFHGFRIDASLTNALDAQYFVRGGPPQLVYFGEPRFLTVSIGRKF